MPGKKNLILTDLKKTKADMVVTSISLKLKAESDIAITFGYRSCNAEDTFAELLGIYTHFVLIIAQMSISLTKS